MKLVIAVSVAVLAMGCKTLSDEGIIARSMLSNGDFSNHLQDWSYGFDKGATGTVSVVDEQLQIEITSMGTTKWDSNVRVHQGGLSLTEDQQYLVEFDAWSDSPRRIMISIWENGHDLDGDAFGWSPHSTATFDLTIERARYSHQFSMDVTNSDAGLAFFLGRTTETVFVGDVYFGLP